MVFTWNMPTPPLPNEQYIKLFAWILTLNKIFWNQLRILDYNRVWCSYSFWIIELTLIKTSNHYKQGVSLILYDNIINTDTDKTIHYGRVCTIL